MIDVFDRWCLFCDFEVHASAREAPQPLLGDYVGDLIARAERGEAKRVFDRENRVTRIAGARRVQLPDGGLALALLITLGDRRGADPAFLHFDNGTARDAEKLEGEVKGASAHCIIRLDEDPELRGRYRMLLEEVRGIGRTPVTRLIGAVLKDIAHERGDRFRNPQTNRFNAVRPVVEVHPRCSREMADALNNASFLPVELIDTRPVPTFDENPEWSVRRHRLSVKVKPQAGRSFRASLAALAEVANRAGYSHMHVSWRLPGERRGGSTSLRTDLADIGTALFAHRELVHIEHGLSECAAVLNGEFVEAMAAQFV